MDSIDITDSTFSLDVPDLHKAMDYSLGGEINSDYSTYIYIGIAILVVIVGIFVFKFYQNKKKEQFDIDTDCPGGFCTINNSSRTI